MDSSMSTEDNKRLDKWLESEEPIDRNNAIKAVSAPPAEREASGSPPEGGDDFGKAPLGLFNRHQILTPIVSFRSFIALECNCVWFLHPSQPC